MAELLPNTETPTSKIIREVKDACPCTGQSQYLCEDGSIWTVHEVPNPDNAFIFWIKCVWFDEQNKTYHARSIYEYNVLHNRLKAEAEALIAERKNKGKQ